MGSSVGFMIRTWREKAKAVVGGRISVGGLGSWCVCEVVTERDTQQLGQNNSDESTTHQGRGLGLLEGHITEEHHFPVLEGAHASVGERASVQKAIDIVEDILKQQRPGMLRIIVRVRFTTMNLLGICWSNEVAVERVQDVALVHCAHCCVNALRDKLSCHATGQLQAGQP